MISRKVKKIMLISTIGKIEKFWKSLRIRQAIAIAPSLVSPTPFAVRPGAGPRLAREMGLGARGHGMAHGVSVGVSKGKPAPS